MRYIVLLATAFIFAPGANANTNTSETCFEMARDYLNSRANDLPEMMIDNKRLRVLDFCRADVEFNQALTQFIFDDGPVHAIHDGQDTAGLDTVVYKI